MLVPVPGEIQSLADVAFTPPNDSDLYWISLFFYVQVQMLASARAGNGRFFVEGDVEEVVTSNLGNIDAWIDGLINDLQAAFTQSGE